jgi:hypothetical protein
MRYAPWDSQPDADAILSDQLLLSCQFPIGVYSPRFGFTNPLGFGQRDLTASSGLLSTGPAGAQGWTLGGGQYVDIGDVRGLLSRTDDQSTSITIISVARLDAAGSFPMLFSQTNSGATQSLELRGSSGSGQPQWTVQTTGGLATATVSSSIVGLGMQAIVATFYGSTQISGTSPTRAAIWTGRQFAEASGGDGLMSTSIDGAARIGVRARGTSFPWSGEIRDMIILAGAIPDALAEEIAWEPEQVYRLCYQPRRIVVARASAPALPTLSALARTNTRRPRYTWTP